MTQFQTAYNKPNSENKKPRKVKTPKVNRKRLFDLITTVNGIGLENVKTINAVVNKAYGIAPKMQPENQISQLALEVIDYLMARPFINPDHKPAGPDLRREGERDRSKIGRDYSQFKRRNTNNSVKRTKSAKKRGVAQTPRLRAFIVPEKYRALNPKNSEPGRLTSLPKFAVKV